MQDNGLLSQLEPMVDLEIARELLNELTKWLAKDVTEECSELLRERMQAQLSKDHASRISSVAKILMKTDLAEKYGFESKFLLLFDFPSSKLQIFWTNRGTQVTIPRFRLIEFGAVFSGNNFAWKFLIFQNKFLNGWY